MLKITFHQRHFRNISIKILFAEFHTTPILFIPLPRKRPAFRSVLVLLILPNYYLRLLVLIYPLKQLLTNIIAIIYLLLYT